ncbi:MAG: T9SS type A sorting domain-containing protein, partial [Bacteroidales bacterium]|nr:T9SS type A sorting domain-containing protein [Bacteroidales bacterium]
AIATFNYSLESGAKYIIVANGIVSAEGYSPATGFDLHVYPMAREMAMEEGNTDVLVFHGATDAPIVDVYEAAIAEATIVDDMAYAEFRGYLELPTADYMLQVMDESGTNIVASYDAPLATLELDNQALVVLASGFLNPANNSDGEAFGLFVALSDGGSLVQLPLSSPMGIEQYSDLNLSIYPNPVSDVLNISLDNDFGKEVSLSIYNSMGQIVENKSFYNENLISINIESLTSGTYYLILNSDAGTIKKNVQVIR